MGIKYVLRESKLLGAPNTWRAVVQRMATADLDKVIEHMVQRGSSVVKADIVSVLEEYYGTIESLVLEGWTVTTPLANFRAGIRGKFDSPTDKFDPTRHRLVVGVTPGKQLRKALLTRVRPVKEDPEEAKPKLFQFTDRNSGALNGRVTPGGLARLAGSDLKFDPADPRQGVFFIGASGKEVRVEVVDRNTARVLVFLVPALSPGEYTLQVRATLNGGEELRTGVLKQQLTVAP